MNETLIYVSGSPSAKEHVYVRPVLGVVGATLRQRMGLLPGDDGRAEVRLHSVGVQPFLHGYTGISAIFGEMDMFCDLRRYW